MKRALLALALSVALLFTAACSTRTEGPSGNDENGGNKPAQTAYQLLSAANASYQEAESYAMTFVMDMDYKQNGESMMTQGMTGDIKVAVEGDDVKLALTSSTSMGDIEAMALSAYYLDGYYYMEMLGQKMKMAMPVEAAMEQSMAMDVQFAESLIKDQTVDGGKLTFTLDGSFLNDMLEEQLQGMFQQTGVEADISYGDVAYTANLGENGELKDVAVTGGASITAEGETMDLALDMTMTIEQIGGVTVEFPDDLDSYTETTLPS
ncbi:hypothetical protein LJC34_02055 [Oscillospiraceae bacterium OttesenSCG-928-G22]|nr:hypothetical protein [Oscillospiraceae bacterium OttesenSCG-928-G22]